MPRRAVPCIAGALAAAVLAATLGRADASTRLRRLLGAMPTDDPFAPHILQAGDGLVDLYVHGLGVARGLRAASADKWLGLPYALPPIGGEGSRDGGGEGGVGGLGGYGPSIRGVPGGACAERRWKRPRLVRTWAAPVNSVNASTSARSSRMDYSHLASGEPLLATTFAPACLSVVSSGSWIRAEPQSEGAVGGGGGGAEEMGTGDAYYPPPSPSLRTPPQTACT
jgi:hypothetical protein